MFYQCTSLTAVPPLNTSKGTSFTGIFYNCPELETVAFTGTVKITKNTTIFSNSPKLTVESLMSLINALVNASSTATYKVTIGATNLAKLTAEQVKIATDKRITLA